MRRSKRLASRLMALAVATSALVSFYARATHCYIGGWTRFTTNTVQVRFEQCFTSWEVIASGVARQNKRRLHRLGQSFQLQRNQVLGRRGEIAAKGSWWLGYQAVPE
jgi:hypothetical protein